MTQANDERAARKQYIRRRQKVVFTITGTILTIALVISLLFFFHVGGLGNVKSAAVQPNYGQQAPCAAQEQDGSKGKYVENRNITVRVLNGTEFAGFAQAVSSALQNREFNTQAAGNYTSSKVERTMIIFGKNAINQAYTVNSNFTDATTQNKRKAMVFSSAMDEMEQRVRDLKEKEDFDAIRPDLNGDEIMQLLGIDPGPLVGKAYKHMLEYRLDNGPVERDVAVAELNRWYEEQQAE